MIWLIIACLLWGPSFGLVPILLGKYGMNPQTLAVLRMGYALLLFLPMMRPRKYLPSKRWALVALGGLQFGAMYLTLFFAYRFLEGYEVALVTIFTPLYVSILGCLFDRGDLKLRPLLCVLAAVLGAGLVKYARPPEAEGFWIGFAIMQACNLCFASGQILYRKLMRHTVRFEDAHVFGWLYLGALAVTLVGWWTTGNPVDSFHLLRTLPLSGWGIVLWLGLVPSGLAFFLFNHGALNVDAHTLAIVNNLKIPIALLIALLIFRQRDTIADWPRFLAGSLLMLGALWWHTHPRRTPKSTAESPTVS